MSGVFHEILFFFLQAPMTDGRRKAIPQKCFEAFLWDYKGDQVEEEEQEEATALLIGPVSRNLH